ASSNCTKRGPHRRTLHSVPTRRPSDLLTSSTARVLSKLLETPLMLRSTSACAEVLLVTATVSDRISRWSRCGSSGAGRPEADLPDRKSTRLNSSHVKISYAVFCLKKKK